MNPTEYIENAIVTNSQDFDAIRARLTNRNIQLLHAAIGAATEAGELLDAIKKALFYGKTVDEVNFKEEIGDSLWYFAIAIHELDASFEELMGTNIAKLRARYGDKFSAARALKRDLDSERKILEQDDHSAIQKVKEL
jgi:NTP pyrophosphatase (non-canonical NTP hydrolase)